MVQQSTTNPNCLYFFMFGWDGKELSAVSREVNVTRFIITKTHMIGNVLQHLAQQDKRYLVKSEFINRRIRVCDVYLAQA